MAGQKKREATQNGNCLDDKTFVAFSFRCCFQKRLFPQIVFRSLPMMLHAFAKELIYNDIKIPVTIYSRLDVNKPEFKWNNARNTNTFYHSFRCHYGIPVPNEIDGLCTLIAWNLLWNWIQYESKRRFHLDLSHQHKFLFWDEWESSVRRHFVFILN